MSDRTLLEKVAQRVSSEDVSLSDLDSEEKQTLAWSGIASGMLAKEASVKIAGFWSRLLRSEVRAAKGKATASRQHVLEVQEAEAKKYLTGIFGRKLSPAAQEAKYEKARKAGKLKKTDVATTELSAAEKALKEARTKANVTLAGTAATVGAGTLGYMGGKKLIQGHRERKAYGDYA